MQKQHSVCNRPKLMQCIVWKELQHYIDLYILPDNFSLTGHSGADQTFLCMLELMLQYHSITLYKTQNKLPALKSPFLRTEIYFSHLEQNPAKLSVI